MDGYNDLNVFYNDLAAISSGDLLWLSTDDVIVETQDWDEVIINGCDNKYDDNIFIVSFMNNGEFFPPQRAPVVSKELYKKLGYLSPYRAWDKYLNILATNLDRRILIDNLKLRPSKIEHKRRGGLSHSETHIIGNRELTSYVERDVKKIFNG